jgi:hypothetical protein
MHLIIIALWEWRYLFDNWRDDSITANILIMFLFRWAGNLSFICVPYMTFDQFHWSLIVHNLQYIHT